MPKKRLKGFSQPSASKTKLGVSLTPTGIDLLNRMATETGLSKSALVDQIVKGEIVVHAPTTTTRINLISDADQDSLEQIQIHVEEATEAKTDPIAAGNTIELETYQTLKDEYQQQSNQLQQLQQKLVNQTQDQDSLKQQLQQKHKEVEQLQTQLAGNKKASAKPSNSIPQEEYQALQQALEEKTHQFTALQQQLTQQQRDTEQRLSQLSGLQRQLTHQAENYTSLQRKSQEQTNLIQDLQRQLMALQSVSNIGETQLNKWRYRTFPRS